MIVLFYLGQLIIGIMDFVWLFLTWPYAVSGFIINSDTFDLRGKTKMPDEFRRARDGIIILWVITHFAWIVFLCWLAVMWYIRLTGGQQ